MKKRTLDSAEAALARRFVASCRAVISNRPFKSVVLEASANSEDNQTASWPLSDCDFLLLAGCFRLMGKLNLMHK